MHDYTSLDLVPPFITPEQLHGSYMGSILHQAESVSNLVDVLYRLPMFQ